MAQKGVKGIRAAFADATGKLASVADRPDPPPDVPRDGMAPGEWPGAPVDRLPPDCNVVPLGVSGKTCWFVDSVEQLIGVATNEWGKKMLLQLFCATPNRVGYYWPRWSEGKKGKAPVINGVEVDEACACLMKAAASKGLFDPAGRVRGRGAWADSAGRLIWHAGEALYMVEGKKLKASLPGEVDNIFYPRRPGILTPWAEPVDPTDSPAKKIFDLLCSWTWERPLIDPLIALGDLGVMILGGALPWRPHVAATGDAGTGKSALNACIKGALGSVLIDAANTTEAGVRQHMGLDALPVAIDEFEGSEDNRRVSGILELARISSSGGRMLRGGQDHKGVEFQARNAFFCSGINLPPMKAQDKSRFAVLNLNKLKVGGNSAPVISEADGRMILRALMDAWPHFHQNFADWRSVLRGSGLDSRAQDTYGTLFTVAQMLLGLETLEEVGLPVTDAERLGIMIAEATASERADRIDNWRAAFEHALGVPIEAWKGGEKPTIGIALENLEQGAWTLDAANERLSVAGVRAIEEADSALPAGKRHYLLCVPQNSPSLARLYAGSRWSGGGWYGALKQGRESKVVRSDDKVIRINRVPSRCVVVDLMQYDKVVGGAA
jgi:hypothetical protein